MDEMAAAKARADFKADKENVLLDGALVSPAVIDPARHAFVGMFRPPSDPAEKMVENYFANKDPNAPYREVIFMCRCGGQLYTQQDNRAHYLMGCWDRAQYVTIPNSASIEKIGAGDE
jgi:hypothetical protein